MIRNFHILFFPLTSPLQYIELKKTKTGVKFGKRRKSVKNDPKDLSKIGWLVIFAAFILKFSFVIALFFLYYISFFQVNLINLGLVTLFFLFFANISTSVMYRFYHKKKREYEFREVEFMQK